MRTLVLLAVTLMSMIPSSSRAELSQFELQSIKGVIGTESVEFEETSSRGQLIGCSLLYRVMILDNIYTRGQPVIVFGNIGMMSANGNIAPTLKVGLNDITALLPNLSTTSHLPSFAYLVSSAGENNAKTVINHGASDTPGALFVVFQPDELNAAIHLDMLTSKKITIAVTRQNGATDLKVPLELDIVASVLDLNTGAMARKRNDSELSEYIKCLGQLRKNTATRAN